MVIMLNQLTRIDHGLVCFFYFLALAKSTQMYGLIGLVCIRCELVLPIEYKLGFKPGTPLINLVFIRPDPFATCPNQGAQKTVRIHKLRWIRPFLAPQEATKYYKQRTQFSATPFLHSPSPFSLYFPLPSLYFTPLLSFRKQTHHSNPMPPPHLHLPLTSLSLSLSLILKLAATSLTGITALVACRNMLRNDTLQAQFHHIRTSLRILRRPPTIYLLGYKGRGKSAFLNTACRVLGEEDGPLVFRSETAPLGPTRTTVEMSAVHVSAGDEDGERCLVTFVDTPGLPLRFLRRGDVEEALRLVPEAAVSAPDCVVVVLRCSDVLQRVADMRLAEIVAVVRERGRGGRRR